MPPLPQKVTFYDAKIAVTTSTSSSPQIVVGKPKMSTSRLITPIADRTVEDIVPLAHTSTKIIVLDGRMDE